jgi:hypothetical protein
LLTPSIVIVGLLNILVIGLFFVFAFKRKVTLTTYADKVVFNSNLLLMLVSLHYLNAISLYISECLHNSLPLLPALLIPDLGAFLFWALLIYVVKKILLRRALVTIKVVSPVVIRKESTNFKLIAITLIPVIAFIGYFLYPSFSPKFSNKLNVQVNCEKFEGAIEFSVSKDRNEVAAIRKIYEHKNLIFSDIVKLEDCVIVDSKNWACGGTPYSHGRISAKDSAIDGKYSYENYGQSSMWDSCKFK